MMECGPSSAEAAGFEPARLLRSTGFQDRRIRPLCHTSFALCHLAEASNKRLTIVPCHGATWKSDDGGARHYA